MNWKQVLTLMFSAASVFFPIFGSYAVWWWGSYFFGWNTVTIAGQTIEGTRPIVGILTVVFALASSIGTVLANTLLYNTADREKFFRALPFQDKEPEESKDPQPSSWN